MSEETVTQENTENTVDQQETVATQQTSTESSGDVEMQTTTSDQSSVENTQDQDTSAEGDTTSDSQEKDAATVNSPNDYQVPDFITPEMKQFAYKQGLSNDQFNAVIQQYGYISQTAEQERTNQLKNMADAQLKKWGDKADYHLTLAKRALKTVDKEGELSALLGETGFGNHPVVLRFLSNLGENLREGGFLRGNINKPPGKKTAAEVLYGDQHPTKE